ncbi:MAG TPA: nucleotidyltransferase family protein, partial [bacterium]|nr:nucleotidyltransferase family protein [bacterium]
MSTMVQAVVVAAGAGSRLFPITDVFPKIMMPVGKNDEPLALHIIKHCKKYGITDFVFCLNNKKGKQVVNFLRDGSQYGVNIKYSFSDEPLGTAGELWSACNKNLIRAPTIIYYGDT